MSPIVEALKKAVRARGLTYADLGRELRLSEASVKRLFSRGTFTLSRIEEILSVLEIDLGELARLSRGARSGSTVLSLEQEVALARDSRLLSVFWLVLNDWQFPAILDEYAIKRTELTLVFAELDRLGLIDWRQGDRARLRIAKHFVWRPGGPVKKAYGRQVTAEFLDARFDAETDLLRFEAREMSRESMAIMRRRLERLVLEVNELAEIDATLPLARRTGVGVLVACRPWTFSVVNALKQRR